MTREFRISHEGKMLESHHTLRDASRAFWVFVAHEVKNGRDPGSVVLHGGKAMPWADLFDSGHWVAGVLK